MKRLIRRIINWAYGDNIATRFAILEQRQSNLSIMFLDTILSKAYLDAGFKPGDTLHCEEIKTWPNTPGEDKGEKEK